MSGNEKDYVSHVESHLDSFKKGEYMGWLDGLSAGATVFVYGAVSGEVEIVHADMTTLRVKAVQIDGSDGAVVRDGEFSRATGERISDKDAPKTSRKPDRLFPSIRIALARHGKIK